MRNPIARGHLAGLALLGMATFGLVCQPAAAHAARQAAGVTLNLVAYSTPQEAYSLIVPAFQQTKAGRNVGVAGSYGASGDQSRKVAAGLPADVVNFSLEPDVTRLVDAKLVSPDWNKNAYHGMVTDSIVVFGVRKGNPKHIKTWSDLLKRGVDVITPNPFTSGGARWNIMAAYGAQRALGKTHQQAVDYLAQLFSHVSVQDSSARQELQTFVGGKGDVMLAYENEMIQAKQQKQNVDYVIPPQTILIENPAAVTTTTKYATQARAFLSFLTSKTAQRLFGKAGYRPVVKSVLSTFHFARPRTLFTISKFGGWALVQKQFFDPNTGIMAGIEKK